MTSAAVRHAARVLLVDDTERVLLFRSVAEETGEPFWFPVGGGMEDGEDARSAARREVAEETGRHDIVIGAEVWHRRHLFRWRGAHYDQRERWFLARTPAFELSPDGWTDDELDYVKGWRWWSLHELATTTQRLVPIDLAERLRGLLRDGPPPEPITVGE